MKSTSIWRYFLAAAGAEDKVDGAELYDRDPTLEHRDLLHHAQAILKWTLYIVEGFWKQNAGSH